MSCVRFHTGYRGNEAFLIRMWKFLSSRRVLKPWGWRRYIIGQIEQYLLAVRNGIRARHQKVCQWGRWTTKESGLWDPTSIKKGNELFLIKVETLHYSSKVWWSWRSWVFFRWERDRVKYIKSCEENQVKSRDFLF